MALLDDILLGNRRARGRRSFVESLEESRVVNLSDSGIQFSIPDTRASTALARDVLLDTIGYVPPNFGMTASAPIAFEDGSGTADLLKEAGITKGSSLDEVSNALTGADLFSVPEQERTGLTQFLNDLLTPRRGSQSSNGGIGPNQGGVSGAGSVTTPIEDYLNSYRKGNNGGLPTDLQAIVDFLEETESTFDELVAPRRRG